MRSGGTPPTLSSASDNATAGYPYAPAAGGTTVAIKGMNLTGATAVNIGGAAATSVVVVSSTLIRCTAPARPAGSYNVVVTTPGGTGTLTSGLTYLPAATTPLAIANWAAVSSGENGYWGGDGGAGGQGGRYKQGVNTSLSQGTYGVFIGVGSNSTYLGNIGSEISNQTGTDGGIGAHRTDNFAGAGITLTAFGVRVSDGGGSGYYHYENGPTYWTRAPGGTSGGDGGESGASGGPGGFGGGGGGGAALELQNGRLMDIGDGGQGGPGAIFLRYLVTAGFIAGGYRTIVDGYVHHVLTSGNAVVY